MWWMIFLLEIVVCGISIFLSYREGKQNVVHLDIRLTIPAYLTLAVLISFFLPFPYIFVGFAVVVCTLYIDKSIL